VPFFLDHDKLEMIVSRPVKDEKIIDLKGSPNDNMRNKKLTAFVGPTSPIKVVIFFSVRIFVYVIFIIG
jgi:hypothetical protein